MGIEEEADRTLFIRNIDTRVTEELLFELFLQAGPLIRTKIPKDSDGKQKTFGFAVYKHDVSVPYAMQLLNGTTLFGKTIQVQFRTGSSHSSSPANSSPVNTPNPHGHRTPVHFSSPPYTPPHHVQRSFSSPDSLQKHAMRNMWQLQQQQLELISSSLQRQTSAPGGNFSRGGARQHEGGFHRHHPPQMGGGRNQRYAEEQRGTGRHQHLYGRENDRGISRHHDDRGQNRHYDERGSQRSHRENEGRWRRY